MEEKQYFGGSFIERLQYYMQEKGINDNQMTVNAGLSVGLIGKAKSSTKGMNATNIEKILLAYPDLNSDWLLTGRGDMLKTERPPMQQTTTQECSTRDKITKNEANRQTFEYKSEKKIAHRVPEGRKEGIPLIPIEAMAGALTSEQTVLEYECERYVVPVFKGADFLIPVKGSSMYPKYSSGDIVACQRVPMSDLFFQWNKVYVIDTNQGALIKRIKPGSTSDRILIVSDNEKYDPFELPVSAIHAVALVIGVIRLE